MDPSYISLRGDSMPIAEGKRFAAFCNTVLVPLHLTEWLAHKKDANNQKQQLGRAAWPISETVTM